MVDTPSSCQMAVDVAGDGTGAEASHSPPPATEDAWLKLHKEVLSAVVAQNKRLIAIIKKQKEYVTKQDLQMLKDKIAEKITRAVPAIARKLMDDIKERQACDDESVAKLVRYLKEQICQFVNILR
ncbi:hypothetical protein Bca52824_044731 [Brassica carinata]|uniref:Uncharacterized protein n=1 Tax=Brassica carinata TaxID=52824 RepID=A0A8X7RBS8_BRACI|nr:hypothetical protein Bca52824_044731 [Brassica carinata]